MSFVLNQKRKKFSPYAALTDKFVHSKVNIFSADLKSGRISRSKAVNLVILFKYFILNKNSYKCFFKVGGGGSGFVISINVTFLKIKFSGRKGVEITVDVLHTFGHFVI